jgi:DNA-binding IclR family transcriptional regulator
MAQSVDRALVILASLAEGPSSLEQAATRIGVHKSTALRLLRTLEEHGFVHRQSDYRYRLGGKLFSLAQLALESIDVRVVAAPSTWPSTRTARSPMSTSWRAATRYGCTRGSANARR